MIHFSSITMRDLIRNYRLIIQGKVAESDTDCDPLMSSASSLQGYGTSQDAQIFRQDSSYTESEDDRARRKKKITVPLNVQDSSNTTKKLFPSSSVENIYTKLQRISTLDDLYLTQATLLSPHKITMNNSSQETFGESVEPKKKTNSSIVTIFSIWNTTMGSSLLAMAWGINKSGLFSGIVINILVAALCLYTAYIILNINEKHGETDQNFEVPEICLLLLGKWAEILAKIFSIIVLIGANIVYWILMSNFLYYSVYLIYDMAINSNQIQLGSNSVICFEEVLLNQSGSLQNNVRPILQNSSFEQFWDLYSTVPMILGVVMFPFLNFKSPTFFTKFNSLGTMSIGYIIVFVLIKSFGWGINIQNWTSEFHIKGSFFALSGMLSLSYFIHNIIISVMRHNKEQKHNGRDLIIAFSLITFTYLFVGVVFYICFPLAKSCIEDNFLNNFSKRDTMTIIARMLLLFQLFTVFPLISFMLRNDVMTNLTLIFNNKSCREFSYSRVILINLVIVLVCVAFACFLPRIGTLIRYTGALSGMVYVFLLPNLLKIVSLQKEKSLSLPQLIIHVFIMLVGAVNLVCQFFIQDT